MPRVTVETVDYVAALAQLTLSDDERVLFARQLDEILLWAELLQRLEIGDTPPMSHALAGDTWREDEPHARLDRERVLAEAPDPSEGLFRVPRVIG